MPWKWRRRWNSPKHPGVFCELLEGGWLTVTPPPEQLSPSELEWAENAQLELWVEWCEHDWPVQPGRT